MNKWFLSALLALGVLSATAGAAGAAEFTEPATMAVHSENTIETSNFGWGA